MNNLLNDNFACMKANNPIQGNEDCLKLQGIVNIMSNNSNKSDKIAGRLYIKQKMNIATSLIHIFRKYGLLILIGFHNPTTKNIPITLDLYYNRRREYL